MLRVEGFSSSNSDRNSGQPSLQVLPATSLSLRNNRVVGRNTDQLATAGPPSAESVVQ